MVAGISGPAVLADEAHVLRTDEERDRRLGWRQVGARRRVDGLQHLTAPAELDAIGRGLDDGALENVAHAHDAGHRLRGRLPQQLGARRRLHDAAGVVDDDAVGEAVGLGEVVGDHDGGGGDLAQQRAQLVAQRQSSRGVEGGERLVQQQERRLDGQRAPERDALALAARELARIPALEPGETQARQRQVAQSEGHVVGDGEVREQRVALEDVADATLLRRQVDAARGVEEHAIAEHDASAVGPDEAGQALQRQRLAGAGGTEQHGHAVARAPRHVEREAGQPRGERDVEADRRRRHAARAPRRPAATSTTHDSSVRTATSTTASLVSPVCTAV